MISESPTLVGPRCRTGVGPRRVQVEWSVTVVGPLAKVYDFTDANGSRPDAWRYFQEVESKGKPADATGYR